MRPGDILGRIFFMLSQKSIIGIYPRSTRRARIIGLFSLSHEQNKAPFYGTFSRHDITRTSSVLFTWLNENVRFNYAVARKQRRSQFRRNLYGFY